MSVWEENFGRKTEGKGAGSRSAWRFYLLWRIVVKFFAVPQPHLNKTSPAATARDTALLNKVSSLCSHICNALLGIQDQSLSTIRLFTPNVHLCVNGNLRSSVKATREAALKIWPKCVILSGGIIRLCLCRKDLWCLKISPMYYLVSQQCFLWGMTN